MMLKSKKKNWLKYRKYVSSHVPTLNKDIDNGLDIKNQITKFNSLLEGAALHATPLPDDKQEHTHTYTNIDIEEPGEIGGSSLQRTRSHRLGVHGGCGRADFGN